MTLREEVISILNELLETSIDGEEGFRKAAEDAQNVGLKAYFMSRSEELSQSIEELQNLVISFGGKPTHSSSLSGSLHRHWIELKTAISNNDSVTVMDETERGEDAALANYRKAAQKNLPENVRSVVERQLEGILRNHNRVKQLRDNTRELRN